MLILPSGNISLAASMSLVRFAFSCVRFAGVLVCLEVASRSLVLLRLAGRVRDCYLRAWVLVCTRCRQPGGWIPRCLLWLGIYRMAGLGRWRQQSIFFPYMVLHLDAQAAQLKGKLQHISCYFMYAFPIPFFCFQTCWLCLIPCICVRI